MEHPPEPLVTPRLFDQILGARGNLVALRVADVEQAIGQFRQAALRGGQAIYRWQPGTGVVSLRDAEVHVPGGHQLADALQHVLQSIHFGIYLLDRFEPQMKAPELRLLRRIARVRSGNDRKIVFLASEFAFASEIESAIEYVSPANTGACRPRLRDGRWVL